MVKRQSAHERQRRKIKHHGKVMERGISKLRRLYPLGVLQQISRTNPQWTSQMAFKLGRNPRTVVRNFQVTRWK